MTIHLTPQQQEALDRGAGEPSRLVDPRTNASYVLVPEAEYETVRELIEDEHRRQSIHAIAVRNAVGRMDETP